MIVVKKLVIKVTIMKGDTMNQSTRFVSLNRNLVSLLIVFIFVSFLFFVSGCGRKSKGEEVFNELVVKPKEGKADVWLCLCRDCKRVSKFNGWFPVPDTTSGTLLVFNKPTEDSLSKCRKSCYKLDNVGSAESELRLNKKLYGPDFKLVGLKMNEAKSLSKRFKLNSLGKDEFISLRSFTPEEIVENSDYTNANDLARDYPILAFMKRPCYCGFGYCTTEKSVPQTTIAQQSFSVIDDTYCVNQDFEVMYRVHDPYCWYYAWKNSGFDKNFNVPKCSEIKKLEDVPIYGCVCGDLKPENVIDSLHRKCCDNNKIKECDI